VYTDIEPIVYQVSSSGEAEVSGVTEATVEISRVSTVPTRAKVERSGVRRLASSAVATVVSRAAMGRRIGTQTIGTMDLCAGIVTVQLAGAHCGGAQASSNGEVCKSRNQRCFYGAVMLSTKNSMVHISAPSAS